MIKKYMNQLYKELIWYKKKIDSGKLQYFGKRDIGNANCFEVLLKDGSYLYINIGTNNIPNIRKKDIAYINKRIDIHYFCDSDNGFTRFTDTDRYCYCREIERARRRYKTDWEKEIDTGSWD